MKHRSEPVQPTTTPQPETTGLDQFLAQLGEALKMVGVSDPTTAFKVIVVAILIILVLALGWVVIDLLFGTHNQITARAERKPGRR